MTNVAKSNFCLRNAALGYRHACYLQNCGFKLKTLWLKYEEVVRVIPHQINKEKTHFQLDPLKTELFLEDCNPHGDKYSCQILLPYGSYIFDSRHPTLSKNLFFGHKFS
jgi:hypothetical protein